MLPARLLLIDDHALFRRGLHMVLAAGIPGLEATEVASLEEAMHCTMASPALVLLDVHLHGLNGIEGIALVKRKWPDAVVIMLSSQAEPQMVALALDRGAATFVSKAASVDTILSVIDEVRRGRLPPPTSSAAPSTPATGDAEAQRLTPRQCEVLNLMCQGLSNKLIGRRLNLSENTVRGHVQAVLAALQVSSRSEASFAARQRGLVG